MSCEIWDEEIALHAGADEVSAEFLGHLEDCARCQGEVRELRQSMRVWTDWTPRAKKRRLPYWLAAAALLPLAFLREEPTETLALSMPAAPVAPKVEFSARPVVIAKRPLSPVTIKLFTDDPDVIILLIGDAE